MPVLANLTSLPTNTPDSRPSPLSAAMRRVFIKSAIALSAGSTLLVATASNANNALAVNRSARMRALSQRFTKLKAQQLLLGSSDAITDTLLSVEKTMASHMQFLASTVSDPKGKQLVEQLRVQEAVLVKFSAPAATKESVAATNKAASETLKIANDLTLVLEGISKAKEVSLVNLAGRQRMLSQRMAKQYFLIAATIEDKSTFAAIDADRTAFNEALKTLNDSTLATPKIKEELAKTGASFKRYDALLSDRTDKGSAKPQLISIASMSEQLLAQCNEITFQFEDLVKAKELSA